MRVRTNGGRTQWGELLVSRESTLPPPAAIPTLDSVTPSTIGAGVDTFIECHGKGFGISPGVITTPVTPPGGTPPPAIFTTTYPVASGAADADTVVVARIWPTTASIVKVQVKNQENNQITDDIRIFVEPLLSLTLLRLPLPALLVFSPAVAPYCISQVRIWKIFLILVGVAYQGFTFPTPTPTATSAIVTVTADLNTPLTGNQATNLKLTDGDHASYPFSFEVIPNVNPSKSFPPLQRQSSCAPSSLP